MNCRRPIIFFIYLLILLLFLFQSGGIIAANYYVSSSIGNDSNPGTSEELPWRSLEKVNSFFKLSPGDQILFKRGDSWNGYLKINISGLGEKRITYGAYGTGNNPRFFGSEQIVGWTLYTGNIFKASFNKNISQLFIDNTRMKAARFPNDGYALISGVNSSVAFNSSDLKSDINYKGAKWIGRTVPYAMATINVASSNGQSIQLSETPYSDLNINEGFILVGKLDFLDSPGEWYYDNESKTVYLWTQNGDSPSNYEIRGSVINYGIEINQKKYVTIKELDLLQYKIGGVLLSSSSFVNIERNNVFYPESRGIYGESGSYNNIENNTVKGASHFGIELFETNDKVTGNKVFDTFLFNNIGTSGAGEWWYMGSGIYIEGNDNLIQSNSIFNAGYHGIHFNKRNIVEYNYIKNVMLTKDDGGGIYTSSYNSYPNPATKGSIIRYNIIDGSWGNLDGYNFYGFRQGFGIYLDENAGGVTVEYNTVANCSAVGIGLHKSFNEIVRHNTLFNAKTLFNINTDLGGTQFTNNILYALNKSTDNDDIQVLIGKSRGNAIINNNTYINHYNTTEIFRTEVIGRHSFSIWKNLTNQDANSTIDVSKLATGETEKLFYNETNQTVIFYLGNAVFRDIYGKSMRDTFSLKPFNSKILIGKEFNKINRKPEITDQSFTFISPKSKNDTIGVIFATESDNNQNLTYSLITNYKDLFAIHPTNGRLYLLNEINTSKDKFFELVVQVSDNSLSSLSDSAKITIYVIGTDISPPVINSFSLPDTSFRLKVPILNLIATDDLGVTGYFISEKKEIQNPENDWLTSPPDYYTFSNYGLNTLFSWARDSAGNISAPSAISIFIYEPDLSPQSSMYLFEETSGNSIIDSTGINNGQIINQLNRTVGAHGKGIEFTGQGYIDLGKSFGESVVNSITLSAWIKPNISNEEYLPVIAHEGSNGDTYGIYLHTEKKEIEFLTLGTSESSLTINNINTLWDGEWHLLTVVYDGFEKTIYLDNTKLISKNITGEIDTDWNNNLYIGAGIIRGNSFALYEGFIDEVRIYNYALNFQQIQEIYNNTNRLLKKIITTEYISICKGQNYNEWSESGKYERILKRIPNIYSGADSIVITYLSVNPVINVEKTVEICQGETFFFDSTEISIEGIYNGVFSSVAGCDSIVTLKLIVNHSSYSEMEVIICDGETYHFNNQLINKTGRYIQKNNTISGCDSITVLILTVMPEYNIIEEVTIPPTENYHGWTNDGYYQRYLSTITGCDSIVNTILKIAPIEHQIIKLEKGWNIVSTYISPENENIESVMASLLSNKSLIKVIDENYNIFEKDKNLIEWTNNIGNFHLTEAYKVKLEFQDSLMIQGFSAELPVIIEIKKGVNFISFPLKNSVNAMQVMNELIDSGIVDKIQDEKGNAIEQWDELGWINGIGNLIPGDGYVIHANNSGVLTIENSYEKASQMLITTETDHFKIIYEGNGLDHMNINIKGLNEGPFKSGDEIAVFDNEVCVGAVKLLESNFEMNAVSIPASASDSDSNNGFLEGNKIELKVWLSNTNKEYKADFDINKGKMFFEKQASVFLKLNGVKSDSEKIDIYPNPSNELINIIYPYTDNQLTEISIFDAIGRKTQSIITQTNPEILNISKLPTGLYFLRVKTNTKEVTEKFIKINY